MPPITFTWSPAAPYRRLLVADLVAADSLAEKHSRVPISAIEIPIPGVLSMGRGMLCTICEHLCRFAIKCWTAVFFE